MEILAIRSSHTPFIQPPKESIESRLARYEGKLSDEDVKAIHAFPSKADLPFLLQLTDHLIEGDEKKIKKRIEDEAVEGVLCSHTNDLETLFEFLRLSLTLSFGKYVTKADSAQFLEIYKQAPSIGQRDSSLMKHLKLIHELHRSKMWVCPEMRFFITSDAAKKEITTPGQKIYRASASRPEELVLVTLGSEEAVKVSKLR